jgi:Ca2+-binding RTX toxin-like protein
MDVVAKITKLLTTLGVNGATAQTLGYKFSGLLSITQSENLGGYLNPNTIDGYSYNPADGRWYAPSAFDGSYDWNNPADPDTQANLDEKRAARELHNKIERPPIGEGDAGTYDAPSLGEFAKWLPEFARYLSDSLRAGEWLPADRFNQAQRVQPLRDPLTLDLDGDGLETVGTSSETPILFDHDGDGVKNGTGWVKPDDGFLVFDRNGNGVIDTGAELFGDSTPLYAGGLAADGFAALAQEDTNQDGVVNSQDANWSSLKVWRDLNQDGVSQAGELLTLAQAGITSFNVNKTAHSQVLANGNQIADLGTFTRTDGSSGDMGNVSQMADINLAEDTFHREFTDSIPLAEGVAALPDMQGSGKVRDLHEAASLSSDLQTLLTQYSQATTRAEQLGLMDQMLLAWADTSGMAETMQERAGTDYIIEYQEFGAQRKSNFTVEDDSSSGSSGSSGSIEGVSPEWAAIVEAWEKKLHVLEAFNGRYFFTLPDETQTGASAVFGITYVPPEDSGDGSGAMGPPRLIIRLSQDQINLLNQSYDELVDSVYSALVMQTRFKPIIDQIELIADEYGLRLGFENLDQYFDEKIVQNNVAGLDELIEFNQQSKAMLGRTAWNGYGLIEHYIRTLPITPELQAFYAESSILISGQANFTTSGSSKNEIFIAGDANDTIRGNAGNDIISGRDGADMLYGDGEDDALLGGADADNLQGGAGNDILEGGAGNDTLIGGIHDGYWGTYSGPGNDTYVFGMGDGQDTIYDNDTTAGNVDAIQFKAGIAPEAVQVSRVNDDLILKIAGTTDQITAKNYFVGDALSGWAIEEIRFADSATIWTTADIKTTVLNGGVGNDKVIGYASADTLNGNGGNDLLYGRDGDDVLNGNADADTLYGENGNDMLNGGDGNDTLSGAAGTDILQGGAGIDNLSDNSGNGFFDGGADNDTLTGGTGQELFIGGAGNDTITTNTGADIIAFNKGEGQDIINGSTGKDNTLSLGNGVQYADLLFKKNANDLILAIGSTDQITLKDWYITANNRNVANLQMIIEGSADYDAASTSQINNKKVVQFNFDGLAAKFDQARAVDTSLTSWALSSSLLEFHLHSSDTEAIGGDLTYQYATNGNPSNVSMTPAQAVLASTQFGTANQALQSTAALQDLSPRLG